MNDLWENWYQIKKCLLPFVQEHFTDNVVDYDIAETWITLSIILETLTLDKS